MKYVLLLYANESEAPKPTPEAYQAWQRFAADAKAAGVLLADNGLSPVTNATTVRVRNGKTLTTDGPFAETHEQLAGVFVVECSDLDDALGWAAKIPMAEYGSVEVRPVYGNQ